MGMTKKVAKINGAMKVETRTVTTTSLSETGGGVFLKVAA
jgi:hypothetical protein